jgi:uncharacterized protein (DUF488 family)
VVKVFTIGHSNHGPEKFVGLLKQHGITMLIDVRSKPHSRMPHFQRDRLLRLMEESAIGYKYGGMVLGGMCGHSVASSLFISKMETVLELAGEHGVALMCAEGKPNECHRAGKLTAFLHRNRPEVETRHILTSGETVCAKEFEPKVNANVRWKEYAPDWTPNLLSTIDKK